MSNVAGVVAQIKWGVIGTLGEQRMKDVILELTKKQEGKKNIDSKQVSASVTKALEKKVKDHNEEVKESKVKWNARTTLAELTKVMERGIGAYKTNPQSVRPSVSSPEQWGYARVNSFLTKAPGTWGRPLDDPKKNGPKGSYGADADIAKEVIKKGEDKKLKTTGLTK